MNHGIDIYRLGVLLWVMLITAQWLAHVARASEVTPQMFDVIQRLATPQNRAPYNETVLPMWEHRLMAVIRVVASYGNLFLDMVENPECLKT